MSPALIIKQRTTTTSVHANVIETQDQFRCNVFLINTQ